MTTTEQTPWPTRLRALAHEPVDPASLAAYRVLFGTLVAVSSARFLAEGWVERCYVLPRFFFHYWGFEWVRVLSPAAMTGCYVALTALGVLVAIGLAYRAAILSFLLLFTYVELIDVTNYLNHYYLVSLLALLLSFLPANAVWSVDARLFPSVRRSHVPAFAIGLLRFQVGIVYFYAALAKVGTDWLVHGQPLELWMSSRTDTPLVGPLLDLPYVPLLMSWAGFLNDLLAVPLLLFRRTRPIGFVMVFVFHAFTGVFFNIGVFPYLMMCNATLWLPHDWPRRLLRLAPMALPAMPAALPRLSIGSFVVALYVAYQVLMPLRTHLYGGSVLWHEQGMRWSWRVMLRQKTGYVTFRVKRDGVDREVLVFPHTYLTAQQELEMVGQPDLVLQLAHRIRDDFRKRGERGVEVRVDALVSLNGRAPQRIIDPDLDLARVEDGVGKATYITDAPAGPPVHFPGMNAAVASRAH